MLETIRETIAIRLFGSTWDEAMRDKVTALQHITSDLANNEFGSEFWKKLMSDTYTFEMICGDASISAIAKAFPSRMSDCVLDEVAVTTLVDSLKGLKGVEHQVFSNIKYATAWERADKEMKGAHLRLCQV